MIAHPSVSDVAVIGVEQDHNEVPRAYIVVAPGVDQSPATARDISSWMDAKVAHHKKLRGGIRFTDQIPKSATGKILRKILKEAVKKEQAAGKAKL